MPSKQTIAKKNVTYSELSDTLDGLLAKLQQPNCDVDEAALLFEAALQCITGMEEHLITAKNRIIKVQNNTGQSGIKAGA